MIHPLLIMVIGNIGYAYRRGDARAGNFSMIFRLGGDRQQIEWLIIYNMYARSDLILLQTSMVMHRSRGQKVRRVLQ